MQNMIFLELDFIILRVEFKKQQLLGVGENV